MFSTYMTITCRRSMREDQFAVRVDGLFTNAWAALGSMPVCHCEQCRNIAQARKRWSIGDKFKRTTVYRSEALRFHRQREERGTFTSPTLGEQDSVNGQPWSSLGLANGSSATTGPRRDDSRSWDAALQGPRVHARAKGQMSTECEGAWSTGRRAGRNVYKSREEEQMWFD